MRKSSTLNEQTSFLEMKEDMLIGDRSFYLNEDGEQPIVNK